jgi:hypothetical protein
MILCVECKFRQVFDEEPCRTCVRSFPAKPHWELHPELEGNQFIISEVISQ